jgi:hypothetical protein
MSLSEALQLMTLPRDRNLDRVTDIGVRLTEGDHKRIDRRDTEENGMGVDDHPFVSLDDVYRMTEPQSFSRKRQRVEDNGSQSEQRRQRVESNEEKIERKEEEEKQEQEPIESLATRLLESFYTLYDKKQEEEIETRTSRSIADSIFMPSLQSIVKGRKRFDDVMDMVRQVSAAMKYELSAFQSELIEEFITACAPKIFGSDWEANKLEFYERYQVPVAAADRGHILRVLGMTPRRFGKTTAVAIFVASLLLAVPGLKICVFSIQQRASSLLSALVREAITKTLKGDKYRIVHSNDQKMTILPESAPLNLSEREKRLRTDLSTLFATPGGVDGQYLFIYI